LCLLKTLDMGDELTHLDRIDETGKRLSYPGLDRANRWPGIKRGIEFHCLEAGLIDRKQLARRRIGRIERSFPVPVVPSGTTNMDAARDIAIGC